MENSKSYGGKFGIWITKGKRRRSGDVTPQNIEEEYIPPMALLNTIPSVSSTSSGLSEDFYYHGNTEFTKDDNDEKFTPSPFPRKKARLVGWDDVQCRPIYSTSPSLASSMNEARDDILTDTVMSPDNTVNHLEPPLTYREENLERVEWKGASTKLGQGGNKSYGNSHYKRGLSAITRNILEVFSPKRNTALIQSSHSKHATETNINTTMDTTISDNHTSDECTMQLSPHIQTGQTKKNQVNKVPLISSSRIKASINRQSGSKSFDVLLTPQPQEKSVCVLDSDMTKHQNNKGKEYRSKSSNVSRAMTMEFESDCDDDLISNGGEQKMKKSIYIHQVNQHVKRHMKKKRKLKPTKFEKSKARNICVLNKNPIEMNQSKDYHLQQPSSLSCLSKAKAFFDKLDNTQSLTIDKITKSQYTHGDISSHDGSSLSIHRRKSGQCVRTRKRTNFSDASLCKQHMSYSETCRESGVSPMPLKKFANCRSEFVRQGIYDGFLEED